MSSEIMMFASQTKRVFDDDTMEIDSPSKLNSFFPKFKRVTEAQAHEILPNSLQQPHSTDYIREIKKLDGMLKMRNQELQQKQDTISHLQQQIVELKSQLSKDKVTSEICEGLKTLLASKDRTIQEQKKTIDKLQKDNRLYLFQLNNLQMCENTKLNTHNFDVY